MSESIRQVLREHVLREDEDVTDRFNSEITSSFVVLPAHLKGLKPMTKLTPAGKSVLAKFDGQELGFVSKAPVYDDAVKRLKKVEHKTLIRLLLGKHLRLIKVDGPLPGVHKPSRIGADNLYHYVLRKA
jgi:hypothetical protein